MEKKLNLNSISNLSNHLLISTPSMQDARFARTITYICDHDTNGAMGVVINRNHSIPSRDFFVQLELDHKKIEPACVANTVLKGGPVDSDKGIVLHLSNHTISQWESTLSLSKEIHLTVSKDIIHAIANNQGPEKAQFVLGYAGWSAGQLEAEIYTDSWLLFKIPSPQASKELLFNTAVENRWDWVCDCIGFDLNLMSGGAGHA